MGVRAAAQGRGFEEDLVLAGCVRGSSLEPEARSACQMWQRRLGSGHGHVQESRGELHLERTREGEAGKKRTPEPESGVPVSLS